MNFRRWYADCDLLWLCVLLAMLPALVLIAPIVLMSAAVRRAP